MKTLLAFLFFSALAHANGLPIKQLKQDIQDKVGRAGKVTIRGNSWQLFVRNGPVGFHGGVLDLKAMGTINRSTGAIKITFTDPRPGAAK
jgi:hypothetical protein